MMQKVALTCLFAWLGVVTVVATLEVEAASDTFLINTFVGSDSTPPTIPSNVIATPVATDQIDITWSASTDNLSVAGYQVFRDNSFIATTTLTSYSDSGLTASTTYSYNIRAFDAAGNFSTTSATSSTTTLPVVSTTTPPTTTPTITADSGGSQSTRVAIPAITVSDWRIVTEENRAIITFSTNIPVASEIRWGRTSSFEIGYAAGVLYTTEHRLVITDLSAGSLYELELLLRHRISDEVYTEQFTFTTASGSDTEAPPNVMDFAATLTDEGVVLTWQNPPAADFSKVRIISNDLFFPGDVVDGYLVHDRDGEQAVDTRALSTGARYYTAFVYDAAGNISSGAVTFVQRTSDDLITTVSDIPEPPESIEEILSLDFSVVEFVQLDESVVYAANIPVLSDTLPTTIRIPYTRLPEHLKTIVVTLTHPDDETKRFSFLLRVNTDKTFYEATIGELSARGHYQAVVEIFDFKTKTLTRAQGAIRVVEGSEVVSGSPEMRLVIIWWRWLIVLLLLLLLFVLLRHQFRSRSAEDSAV